MLRKLATHLGGAVFRIDTRSAHVSPAPTRLMRMLVNQAGLAGCLPYNAYLENDAVFVNEDALGFCLEITPQSGADEEMARILSTLYASARPGLGIQFHLYGSPDIHTTLSRYAALRVPDRKPADDLEIGRLPRNTNIYRTLARKRCEYYLQGARHSLLAHHHYLLRHFRLIASVTLPGSPDDVSQLEDLLLLRDAMRTTLHAADFPNRLWD